MEVSAEELADALIRAGWYFPSQAADASTAAQDLLITIENSRRPEAGG